MIRVAPGRAWHPWSSHLLITITSLSVHHNQGRCCCRRPCCALFWVWPLAPLRLRRGTSQASIAFTSIERGNVRGDRVKYSGYRAERPADGDDAAPDSARALIGRGVPLSMSLEPARPRPNLEKVGASASLGARLRHTTIPTRNPQGGRKCLSQPIKSLKSSAHPKSASPKPSRVRSPKLLARSAIWDGSRSDKSAATSPTARSTVTRSP